MPREIKLDCYHFSLKKQMQGEEEYTFEHFFDSFVEDGSVSETRQALFTKFYGDLCNYFGSEFRINRNETKGLTLSSDDRHDIKSHEHIISGFLRGGDTGIGKTIQERTDSASGVDIDHLKIHSIPHYFLMWMPRDLNFCIVMVQSYTAESLSGLFLQHLEKYFSLKDIRTYDRRKFLPQRIVDDFRNNARVSSVTLKSSRLSRQKRQAMNPVLVEKENMTVEMKLKGFGRDTTWDDFRNWLIEPSNQLLGIDLSDVNLDSPVDRVVEYRYQGKTSRGKLTQDFQFVPSLVITDEILPLDSKRHPNFTRIDAYAKTFLNELISEAGYDDLDD